MSNPTSHEASGFDGATVQVSPGGRDAPIAVGTHQVWIGVAHSARFDPDVVVGTDEALVPGTAHDVGSKDGVIHLSVPTKGSPADFQATIRELARRLDAAGAQAVKTPLIGLAGGLSVPVSAGLLADALKQHGGALQLFVEVDTTHLNLARLAFENG